MFKASSGAVSCCDAHFLAIAQIAGLIFHGLNMETRWFPGSLEIVSIFFPYDFRIISTLFPCYFHIIWIFLLKNLKTIWNTCVQYGRSMNPMVSRMLEDYGNILNKLGKRYGIHIETCGIHVKKSGIHMNKYGLNMSSHCPWTKRPSTSKCRRIGYIAYVNPL